MKEFRIIRPRRTFDGTRGALIVFVAFDRSPKDRRIPMETAASGGKHWSKGTEITLT
jgi:hypothetical protein